MPEHVHLLISEPHVGNPSLVMKTLKEEVARTLRNQYVGGHFWQRRFYDFNVWSDSKRNEKLNYIHHNPVKRGLVEQARYWRWSSYSFYWHGEKGLCTPNPEWFYKQAADKRLG